MLDKQGFYNLLNSNNINYESIEHPAVYTMEEIFFYQIPHTEHIVKNLFLRDDKKRNYYLVTISGTKSVDLRSLSEKIPSCKLSFARACLKTPKEADFAEFSFQAREVFCRRAGARQGESDAAGGEKAVKDALQRVLRHALVKRNCWNSSDWKKVM